MSCAEITSIFFFIPIQICFRSVIQPCKLFWLTGILQRKAEVDSKSTLRKAITVDRKTK